MAETDTTADPNAVLNAALQYLVGQRQQAAPPSAPANRSIVSLLGEAVGGGASDVSPADREAAGTRALLNFGANLSAASGPSVMPRNFGQILAQGVGGAEQSLAGSAAVSASRLAAQQAYEEKQQELQISRIKEAIPLLTLQQQIQSAAEARRLAGNQPPSTSIGNVGDVGVPIVARDPKVETAGQQANNSGNIMMTPGAKIAGATGAVPVTGGYVAAFPDVPTGVAAHSDLLTNYAQSGVGTIRDAMTRWVGPKGDPKVMAGYIADVAKAAGVGPDDKVDLSDPKIQRAILLAQQPHESGKPWLAAADVDKGLALAAARRAGTAKAAGPPGATAPAAGPGAPATTAPAAPPSATGGEAAGPGGLPTPSARLTTVSPAAQTDADIIAKGMVGAGADATTLAPPGAPLEPVQTAGPGAPTAPNTATAQAAPPASPQYPDIKSGDLTVSHPGNFADFYARESAPTPTTEDFNPNLSPAQQTAFADKAAGIAKRAAALDQQQKLLGTLPFADQPKAAAELVQQRAALGAERDNLAAEQQTAAQAKAQAAAAVQTKFDTEQRDAVQKRYDAALTHYRDVAKGQITFNQDIIKSQAGKRDEANQKLLEPYQNGALQAQSILPNVALARQVEPMLPGAASPWLNKPENRDKLAPFEKYLPENWKQALQGADLFTQAVNAMITQMGANLISGQPGGREAAYQQFRTMLPSLAQSQSGRELALTFVEELAQRRIAENEFMQNYSWDPKNRDPEFHVPNMSGALTAMNKPGALPPMLKLPPVSYDPNLPGTDLKAMDNRTKYNDYYGKIQPGGRYITYAVDEKGLAHPVAKTKRPPVKDPTTGKLVDQPPEAGED